MGSSESPKLTVWNFILLFYDCAYTKVHRHWIKSKEIVKPTNSLQPKKSTAEIIKCFKVVCYPLTITKINNFKPSPSFLVGHPVGIFTNFSIQQLIALQS